MPKLVPIITDWTEEERLTLAQKLNPTCSITRETSWDQSLGDDCECWYSAVRPEEGLYTNTGLGQATYTYMFKLTVNHCEEYLGKRLS